MCLLTSEEVAARARLLHERLASCDICPHRCGVNRLAGQVGRCQVGVVVEIASICDHHGEEPVLSGSRGAGTVFVAGCNLQCVYCQNYQISQPAMTIYAKFSPQELADGYLQLQARGCHNLEWVSPSHVVPQLVTALALARVQGFRLPVVYNSNGYDAVATLEQLAGIVDIYLPDLKYADRDAALRYSRAPEYPDIAIAAIREMYRQVGDLVIDEDGVARSGLIVRHLVLPNDLAGTREALRRLAEEVSPMVTVSLMAQYYPAHVANSMPELARTITAGEYDDALDAFSAAGLENGWAQDLRDAPEHYRPDFDGTHPFE